MKSKRNNSKESAINSYAKQLGSALIEFCIAAVLLVIFLTGILEAGRLLNQMAAVGQATFLGAMVGSEYDPNAVSETGSVFKRIRKILGLQKRQLTTSSSLPVLSASYNTGLRLYTVNLRGSLPIMFGYIPINMSFTAPMLVGKSKPRWPGNSGQSC